MNMKNDDKKRANLIADITTITIVTLILLLPFAIVIAIMLLLFGWEFQGNEWVPFVLAVPTIICFCIYAFKHPTPIQSNKNMKHKSKNHNNKTGGGWYSGCPEDELYSSINNDFDFDGDGSLNSVEKSTKFDMFFGDDE